MRGSLRQRSPGAWSLILEFGYVVDPATGRRKRRQKWITFRGTKREAEQKLASLVTEISRQTFVAPHRRTVGGWLDEWVDKAIKPPRKTPGAYDRYCTVIRLHLKPAFGHLRLQALGPLDLETYYARQAEAGYSPATLQQHHTIVHSALEAAVRSSLVARNVAKLVNNKPHAPAAHAGIAAHCWTAEDAAVFLRAAKQAGSQPAAFYSLALDSGMRKAELCGLRWSDLDMARACVTVQRQLLKSGQEPVYGPVKNNRPRTIDLAAETIDLLKKHRRHQAALKLRNRPYYHDHGLIFAKEWGELRKGRGTLGEPLQVNNLGQREYIRLIAAAGVKSIKFHGLRHTCATLLLSAGVPQKVVQERLGHQNIATTLDIYAHVLPSMQREAARKLAALLHGS